jgi:NitT/TauT family transport system permease protein
MATQEMEMTIDAPAAPPTAERLAPRATPPADAEPTAAIAHAGRGRWRLTPLALPLLAAAAWAIHHWVPSRQSPNPTRLYPRLLVFAIAFGLFISLTQRLWRSRELTLGNFSFAAPVNVLHWCVASSAILTAGVVLLCAWDLITLKFAMMPLPYFPGPDAVIQTLVDGWRSPGRGQPGLADCMLHSLALLGSGYITGSLAGVVCGVLIGWFPRARFWGMPIMKLVGPIPATAFIPLTLMIFPSALVSAMSLIALAVWFPVTMLTLSGIANVRASYLDVARTLGAGPSYLIFRVAIPAAMPNIFVGLFMGLGSSFLTLIVAEAVGVQAGLGWYIDWARAYSDYTKVYAALVIMAAYFSTIMTLLFKLRDWALVWQKGTIKW